MFDQVIALYRALGRPPIEGGRYFFKGKIDDRIRPLLPVLNDLLERYGKAELYPAAADHLDLEFSFPANEYGGTHEDIEAFLRNSPSLNVGLIPSAFYVFDIDYCSGDPVKPEVLQRLDECCEFIRLLGKLAMDPCAEGAEPTERLVFVLSADGKAPSQTLTLRVKVAPKLLAIRIAHLSLLRALVNPSNTDRRSPHIEERRMILQSAIAEVLASAGSAQAFEFLVLNWNRVLSIYRHNLRAFLCEYSFDKVRKEIASTEIEYATKLSGVLGDVAGKLLGLPIAAGGGVLLVKASSVSEFVIVAAGLITVSVIFLLVIWNQWLQFRRLGDTSSFIFQQYESKLTTYPLKLREPIVRGRRMLLKQVRFLKWTLFVVGGIAIVPTLFVCWMTFHRYGGRIAQWVCELWPR